MVGGASAALAGLVFVAMSLNLATIFQDPTHRFRAIGTLAGFTSVFAICALVLMGGQNHVAVGLEWFVVSTVATVIYVQGYVQAINQGGSAVGLLMHRLFGGTGHLASGALVRVLEDWCAPFPGYFLYYPSRRQQPAALSALIDTLRL